MVRVKKLHVDAILPTRGSALAAGLDLYCIEETILPPQSITLVHTGIAVAFSSEFYGRIAPRSGISARTGVMVNAGVIDCDYRGEIMIVFNNIFDQEVKFAKGDKVAQLILEKIGIIDVIEVDNLDETVRGEDGFGSTDAVASTSV